MTFICLSYGSLPLAKMLLDKKDSFLHAEVIK